MVNYLALATYTTVGNILPTIVIPVSFVNFYCRDVRDT